MFRYCRTGIARRAQVSSPQKRALKHRRRSRLTHKAFIRPEKEMSEMKFASN